MAGAGGFEPPYRGIKIRCLTTWLRPNDRGRLSGKPLPGNKTAGSAPPVRLGRGERSARLFGLATIRKQRKARGAGAAHPRDQSAGEPCEASQHHADRRNKTDRGAR